MTHVTRYLTDDRGAVTIDWTVLSSAAVGLAIATTAIMTDTLDVLSMRMDDELRSRQLSDNWIQFHASHFEPILETGAITEAQAEAIHGAANELMNYDLVSNLTNGIEALEAGSITEEEIVALVALASVAYQRNLVDDGVLNHYFGFDGSDPFYMTVAAAPVNTGTN
ncbi:hypothetical protein KUL25_02995 [Rhodobacteraceae bacterium N5(2021)]|uniref:Uncharacterized protein n=1 Tax=Gymnodinialimonas phycosphaerae TaxID=2841589 RepID=A0A975TWE3_9RHOB|nr:hypothetical protein [Gymnodinialimonas phycosphaerae]MBY4891729.1 hypothetical protein [Gymnodinialimonas phycosphaerae]